MPLNLSSLSPQAQAAAIYIGYYDRAPDPVGSDFWEGVVTAGNLSLAEIATDFSSQAETLAEHPFFADPTASAANAFISELYMNLFNRAPDADGLEFWSGVLQASIDGTGALSVGQIILEIIQGAQDTDEGNDLTTIQNKIAVATAWTDEAEEAGLTGTDAYANDADAQASAKSILDGVTDDSATVTAAEAEAARFFADEEAFTLTTSADNLTGTESNDTFNGEVQQNNEGASANALSTGDVIDGGEGTDKLAATLVNDNQTQNGETLTVNPRAESLEHVYITGMDEDVTLDAGRMDSVEQFWSNDSDENLVIEDVRLGSNLNITKDITFGMRDVDTDSGLSASFDTQSFVKAGDNTSNSQIIVEVGDSNKVAATTTPVERIELELNFTFGGEAYSFESIRSEDGTYQGLATAIESALSAQGLDGLNVTLGDSFDSITAANDDVSLAYDSAQQVVITDPEGAEFTEITSGVGATAGEASSNPVSDVQAVDPTVSSNVIETNLVLDNAGRGSTAGDAIIGGMSNSDQTIDKLNLVVDRDSKIDDLATASNMEDNAFNDADYEGFNEIELTSVGANGTLSIQDIQDTATFDASAFAGKSLTINEASALQTLSANVGADVDVTSSIGDGANAYTTGAGDDSITIALDGDKVDFAGDTLDVSTGAGGDSVTVTFDFDAGDGADDENNQLNQAILDNVNVETGSGDDTITLDSVGNANIDAGSGADFVNTSGSSTSSAVWALNVDADRADAQGLGTQAAEDLPGEELSLAYIGGATVTVTLSGADVGGAVANDDGYESKVEISNLINGNEYFGTQADVNAAILEAVNEDAVLGELLTASIGANNTLVVASTTSGDFEDIDLRVDIAQADQGDDADDWNAVEAEAQAVFSDSDVSIESLADANPAPNSGAAWAGLADSADADAWYDGLSVSGDADNSTDAGVGDGLSNLHTEGTASTSETDNVIDGGAGDDLIVLSTDAVAVDDPAFTEDDNNAMINGASNETIVLIGESFGDDTVVNFGVDGDGIDFLDFSAYLTSKSDGSANVPNSGDSSDSDVLIPVTVEDNAVDVEANEVSVVGYTDDTDETPDFDSLSASDIEALFNNDDGSGDYDGAALEDSDFSVKSDYDKDQPEEELIGDAKGVLMVENEGNDGEYKVFELTWSGDDADVSASLLGSLDFGDTLDGLDGENLVGSDAYKTLLEGGIAGAGGGGGGAGGGGAAVTTAVASADDGTTFDAAPQDTNFDVADGTFEFTITDFDSGDVLDFTDVGGNATAGFNVVSDADQTDGEQQFQATDAGGDIVTVNLVGLTDAQDAGLFNQGSVDTVFGAGTLII